MNTEKNTVGATVQSVNSEQIQQGTGAARARADAAEARADMRSNARAWRATHDAAQLRLAIQARGVARQFQIGAVLLAIGEHAARAQARRVHELRGGVPPSATSIDDASAGAGAAHEVRREAPSGRR